MAEGSPLATLCVKPVPKLLAAAGVTFQRVDAADARACDPAELAQSLRSGPIGVLGDGARACTASHVKAWQYIVDTGLRHALILEWQAAHFFPLGKIIKLQASAE